MLRDELHLKLSLSFHLAPPPSRIPYPLCFLRVYYWDKVSQDAGSVQSLQCGPLEGELSNLNGWMTNGRYGAISRDLPTVDHDIDRHPGPAKVPFPRCTSLFPSPDGLCFEVHYHLSQLSASPLFTYVALLVMTFDSQQPLLTTKSWQVTLVFRISPRPILLPP